VLARGGKVVVITNRDANHDPDTQRNLVDLGLKFDASRVCVLGRAGLDKTETRPDACGGAGLSMTRTGAVAWSAKG
jgi:hypothetical protein